MTKHIILWQLADTLTADEKIAVKAGIKEGLEGLAGQIPGLVDIKVYTEGLPSSNADVMLDSTFESEAALKGYAVESFSAEGIYQTYNVIVIGNAKVFTNFIFNNVFYTYNHNDFCLVRKL